MVSIELPAHVLGAVSLQTPGSGDVSSLCAVLSGCGLSSSVQELQTSIESLCTLVAASAASPNDFLTTLGVCYDIDITGACPQRVEGICRLQDDIANSFERFQRAVSACGPADVACGADWCAWRKVVNGANRMLNRVLEASWLELAGPKQFLLYGSAVKAQFTHLTSCLTTVLQHTLCYHADNDRHFHEAVSICISCSFDCTANSEIMAAQ